MEKEIKVGDVLTINGDKVQVTYVDGRNYSYCPYIEPVVEKSKKPVVSRKKGK